MTSENLPGVENEEVANPQLNLENNESDASEMSSDSSVEKNNEAHNWREARKKIDELERRLEDRDEMIEQLMHQSKTAPQASQEDDELSKLSEEDLITVRQAKKINANIAREVAEEVVRQKEAASAEERLKSKFPDFYDVVTKENLNILEKQDPELALSIYSMSKTPYEQAVAAYKLLKKTIVDGDPVNKRRVAENVKKPLSVQSVPSRSAIHDVHNYDTVPSAEIRKSIWKEMVECAKNY